MWKRALLKLVPAGLLELARVILEETLALVAMALFLATVAVWAAMFCRLL